MNTNQHPKIQPLRAAYTVTEYCEMHTIGRTLFYRLVAEGHIRIVKLGRRTLVPKDQVLGQFASEVA